MQTWASPLGAGLNCAGLGEEDAALRHLEEGLEKRIRQMVWVNVDPRYDGLRPIGSSSSSSPGSA